MHLSKYSLILAAIALATGCDSSTDDGDGGNEMELITTVNLTFTPPGGAAINAKFSDADGPGGVAPMITQPGALTMGTSYALEVELLNESVSPAENITEEVMEEAEEHQLFFQGTAVDNILMVAYADKESDYTTNMTGADLPVGLKTTVTAASAGNGVLQVILKHQPPVNDQPVKTATSDVDDGDTDVDVSFNVRVQ